jgi:secreted trypsin-like serine protease
MRPLLRASLATAAVALIFASPSGAILNGTADTTHPYVGILVTMIDRQPVPVCSGFLVSSTAFVTAAHCVDDLGGSLPAFVSFDQTFTEHSQLLSGTAVPNPAFGSPGRNTHDIALVELDEPVTDRGHADLPSLGLLDSLNKRKGLQDRSLTLVGYGANDFARGGGPPAPVYELTRAYATSRVLNLQSANAGGFSLQLSSNPGQGKGAICFGDSGGPVLLGGSDVAVGINSYTSNTSRCLGNAFAFRLDTAEALGFLAPYLS